jgi:hypothetical protein
MADDIFVNPGTAAGKLKVATQEIGGVHYPVYLLAGLNNGAVDIIESLDGAINQHDADVHHVPVNELFHRHTGVATTLAVAVTGGGSAPSSITVASAVGFVVGNAVQISSATIIESTFPMIIAIVGAVLTLDRPLDNSFAIGDAVEVVTTNMAVNGSVTPVAFRLIPDGSQIWHVVRFLLGMIHNTAADNSRFGNIAGGLTNGCVLRGYNAATGQHRTFTNWKTNADIKMDMYNLDYNDKAGAGNYGTHGRGSIRDGTGAVPYLDGAAGDYLELLIQDDLTGLIRFLLKAQGHIEGL